VSPSDLAIDPVVFALRPGRGTIALHATGFRHPRGRRASADRFTAYADVTHLALGRRVLRIGTLHGIVAIDRDAFVAQGGAEAFVRALFERIATEPTGAVQLARMAEVEETARQPASQRVTRVLVLACLAAWEDQKFCKEELGLEGALGSIDEQKLNVDGGAIALGHPVGASGTRIVLHLLQTLKRKNAKRGIACICIGGGLGGAMMVETV